jgi:hypothetical protein
MGAEDEQNDREPNSHGDTDRLRVSARPDHRAILVRGVLCRSVQHCCRRRSLTGRSAHLVKVDQIDQLDLRRTHDSEFH